MMVAHSVHNNVINSLKVQSVFVNKPASKIAKEGRVSEQALVQSLRDKAIAAFGKEYYGTPLAKKLLE